MLNSMTNYDIALHKQTYFMRQHGNIYVDRLVVLMPIASIIKLVFVGIDRTTIGDLSELYVITY